MRKVKVMIAKVHINTRRQKMKKKDNDNNKNNKNKDAVDIYKDEWQTSVIQCRSAMFAATERPQKKQDEYVCYQKPSISISTDIALDQGHRDILDILFIYGNKKILCVDDGTKIIMVYIPLNKISEIKKTHNIKWIVDKVNDLRKVIVKVKDNNIKATFNILNFYCLVSGKNKNMGYVFEFDRRYVKFFAEGDIPLDYKELLPEIINISSYEIKAVIRYCLSQSEFANEDLFEILEKVGYKVTTVSLRQQRKVKKLFKDNAETLKKFNIVYNHKTNIIKYTRSKKVYHLAQKTNSPTGMIPIISEIPPEQPKPPFL